MNVDDITPMKGFGGGVTASELVRDEVGIWGALGLWKVIGEGESKSESKSESESESGYFHDSIQTLE